MKAFQGYDKNGDGKLDVQELSVLLRKGNKNLDQHDIDTIFNKVDKNADGTVDFEEFVEHVYGEPPLDVLPAPDGVKAKFKEFCGAEMDGKEFAKLCKDCSLIDKKLTSAHVDMIFAKACERGQRKIQIDGFEKVCSLVAKQKGCEVGMVYDAIQGGAKSSTGTVAQGNKFHDDKSLYTGAQGDKLGGHGENESERHIRLEKERLEAHDPGPENDWADAKASFMVFAGKEGALDNREFAKMVKDCKLTNDKFTKNDVDLAFSAVCPHGQRKIEFAGFQKLLHHIAAKRVCNIAELQDMVAAAKPSLHGTTKAGENRFHDDKSLYTGSHAGK